MAIIKAYIRISEDEIKKLAFIKSEEELNEILKERKEHFDIDVSWQVLHYLITGEKDFSEHPFSQLFHPDSHTIILSEEEERLMDEYVDNYMQNETDEIRQIEFKLELSQSFVNPLKIAEIISGLKKIDFNQIVSKADFDTFNQIRLYPEIWSNSTEHKDYIKEHYDSLFSFLQRAKKEKDYIIVL